MCKYCECKENPHFPSLGKRAESIAKGPHEECFITEINGIHYIAVEGETLRISEPIKRCPFCCRIIINKFDPINEVY